jgi:hypothetical protein
MSDSTCPSGVVVKVTTRRYDQPGGAVVWEREASATGPFDTAVLDALAVRLHPWALAQIVGKVLARRPAAGEAIDYLGRFSDVRELIIAVRPAGQPADLPPPKTRPLKGLFLDYTSQGEEQPAPLHDPAAQRSAAPSTSAPSTWSCLDAWGSLVDIYNEGVA